MVNVCLLVNYLGNGLVYFGKMLGLSLHSDMKGRVLATKMVFNEFRTVNGVFK